ncbi:MAG: hypothetical protein ACOYEV_09590 [Candidatus Nanopelagicales bacterium]
MNPLDALGGSDCEGLAAGWMAQPVNMITSFAYVLVAIWAALRIRHLPQAQRLGSAVYAATLALVGLGSVDYHGPQSPAAKFLHDAPIAALAVWVALLLLARRRGGRPLLPGASRRSLIALGVVWAAAIASYPLGRTDSPICDPASLAQVHGLWHVLTALGFGVIFALLFPPVAQEG